MNFSNRCLQITVALLLGAMFSCLPMRFAYAQPVTCSISASPSVLDFGSVDLNTGGSFTTLASVTYSCTNNPGNDRYVQMCFNIFDGVEGSGNSNPRVMKNGAGNALQFQIYQPPLNSSTVWGPTSSNAFSPLVVNLTIPAGGTSERTVTMQGRLTASQSGLPPGAYQDAFTGNNTSATYNVGSSPPSNCLGNPMAGGFGFTAKANIINSCTVKADTLDFGVSTGFLTANTDNTTTVEVTCPSNTAYQIGLDNGQNFSGTRRMAGGSSEFVGYELYKDSNRSLRWGNTPGTDTLTGNPGTGIPQAYPVYGQVPVQSTPSPGTYSDTVTVKVTY